ncbi:type II toxin-antitoxin system HicB family antitoxin [Litoribacter ruber]|uniref:Type II toxin-antitoxin system HicB family antitoxin n=1 Tax=Litoribacter ruber TaxID=702568 RepID=A0AAP2CHV5_9BACT|nr:MULTISPECIES: type II toxin-antitoxin system HicB family antitoxin [Litoribacter]MBS9523919.1 type II toxin-antitoxin system HicB family antitoxin [Litoribacter alkaliphilus]MBT0811486.1 type II toxin-antitoxin system HicB family antitoxin [Litoribacter ruber]
MSRTFRIILKPEPEGGYTVIVPSLPGCETWGESIEEAKAMAKEAIDLYVEDLEAEGEEVPNDSENLEISITVA